MAEEAKVPDMGDLLEYFEARSRSLDAEGQVYLDTSTLQFISLIKFNGVPILPPVLTQSRREEMQAYRREALKRETHVRAKKREELHAKVQSIVAGVEERRAAKQAQASKSASNNSSPASSSGRSSSRRTQNSEVVTRLSGSKSAFSSTTKGIPAEIVINVPTSSQAPANTSGSSKSSGIHSKSSSSKTRSSTVASSTKPSTTTVTPSTSTSSPKTGASAKSTFTNYKSLGKLGSLSKQKSFSSQHLDRSPSSKTGKYESDNSSSSAKNLSLSPKSQGLLPHPPVGRPPSRGSTMRQSASTPDLRNIDFSVREEDLKKPLPSRSRSPKGGRPQAAEKQTDSKVKLKGADKSNKSGTKDGNNQTKSKTSQADQKLLKKSSETIKDNKIKKQETTSKTVMSNDKNKIKQGEKDIHIPNSPKVKSKQANVVLQNPLEILDQELSLEEESERMKRQESVVDPSKMNVRQELDPIQTAAAELFPFPISEEQALATLDSLHSDFASLEQADALPCDYNGIPLTSLKQQQIILMLTKLSKALNIEDTLTSTTGSNASGDPSRENKLDSLKGQRFQSGGENKGIPSGASGRNYSQYEPVETLDTCDDLSVNVTNDSSVTGPSSGSVFSTSASSNHSRARMSPTGSSSILSSASSVSGSRLRMSPKTLKNNVHFSSFVTEISTSASQSYEDKISFRKLDITPKSSENFEEGATSGVDNDQKNLHSSGSNDGSSTPQTPNSLLSKVNLSPSVDSSQGSPGEFHGNQQFPFGMENQDGELNTSDKENEFVQPETESSDENYQNELNVRPNNRNQHVLNVYMANIPAGPIGENHPAVVKTSVKSDASEMSTLKSSREKMAQENISKYNLTVDDQYYYGTVNTDFGRFMHETTATNSSTSSMQEEITKSYLMSKQKSGMEYIPTDENNDIETLAYSALGKGCDETPILLKPVIYGISQSLKENRSMLEEEEMVRSNLQKVELEDSEEDEREDSEDEREDSHVDEAIQIIDVQEEIEPEADQPIKIGAIREQEESSVYKQITIVDIQEEELSEQEEESEIPQPIKTGEVEEEEEAGKADHIQKYLNQVHEQSLQHEENFEKVDVDESIQNGFDDVMDIGSMIQTFTSSIQSLNHLSQDDLFRIQAEQFELIQAKLIEQQRRQLEELFVSQRKEQMSLQSEIEGYQTKIQGQDIETLPLQDSLKPQISESLPQVTQAWQYYPQQSAMSPPFPVQPIASTGFYQQPNTSGISYNTSYGTAPYPDPRAYPDPRSYNPHNYPNPRNVLHGDVMQGHGQDPNLSHVSHNTSYSTIPHQDPGMIRGNLIPNMAPAQQSHDRSSSHASNPFIYPSSPSLYLDPNDRDDVSDVSGFAKATPKQLVFSNQSTPVPKVYKPVLRSPIKQANIQRQPGHVACPSQVLDPAMQPKFDRVSAVVKGYLTRRLLRTEKVQEIVKTIDDTRNFAFSFQAETPIKKGTFTREDRTLLERIVNQLQAALLDIHEIFFMIPVADKMDIIAHSRQLMQERRMRQSQRSSMDSVSRSQPKLSKATLRAMERKRQAKIAEETVFGSTEFRPRSAPPNTSSPHLATDIRALRPLQGQISGQISPIRPDSQITVREVKERPRTAGDKSKSGNKTKKSSGTKTAKATTKPATTSTSNKQKVVPSKSKKMDKAWR